MISSLPSNVRASNLLRIVCYRAGLPSGASFCFRVAYIVAGSSVPLTKHLAAGVSEQRMMAAAMPVFCS